MRTPLVFSNWEGKIRCTSCKHISLPCVEADGTERFEGREAEHQLLHLAHKNFTNAFNSMSSVSRERNAASLWRAGAAQQ